MDRLESPIALEIPMDYWNKVFRDYALIQAVREVAAQLRELNEQLAEKGKK